MTQATHAVPSLLLQMPTPSYCSYHITIIISVITHSPHEIFCGLVSYLWLYSLRNHNLYTKSRHLQLLFLSAVQTAGLFVGHFLALPVTTRWCVHDNGLSNHLEH